MIFFHRCLQWIFRNDFWYLNFEPGVINNSDDDDIIITTTTSTIVNMMTMIIIVITEKVTVSSFLLNSIKYPILMCWDDSSSLWRGLNYNYAPLNLLTSSPSSTKQKHFRPEDEVAKKNYKTVRVEFGSYGGPNRASRVWPCFCHPFWSKVTKSRFLNYSPHFMTPKELFGVLKLIFLTSIKTEWSCNWNKIDFGSLRSLVSGWLKDERRKCR